jgi:hypothetical protein
MPILTEAEADALDELLTNTTPEVNPNVEGPFIKNHRQGMMVSLDRFSAEYLQSRMLGSVRK